VDPFESALEKIVLHRQLIDLGVPHLGCFRRLLHLLRALTEHIRHAPRGLFLTITYLVRMDIVFIN